MDGSSLDLETVSAMIYAAHAVDITPIVRIPGGITSTQSTWIIQAVLQMGALGVIVPRVSSGADARAAVAAAKAPPFGRRSVSRCPFLLPKPVRFDGSDADWINTNVLVSVQAETKNAVRAIEEIVSVSGLDMVQSGRGDLSVEYDVPGEQYHPLVLQAEKRMIKAGLDAGKLVSVQYYPLRDPSHLQIIKDMIARGVHCLSLGSDRDLVHVIRRVLKAF
jgi:4-hydroxy-2-oxoheptanedioate aldolase